MQSTPFHIIAPKLGLPGAGDAHALGAVARLWMHSARHRKLAPTLQSRILMAPLEAQQYLVASVADDDGDFVPVAYMAWANFNAESEARFVRQSDRLRLLPEDWDSGDRMWITDWVAPFGHARALRELVATLFADSCFRVLHECGEAPSPRVKTIRGEQMSVAAEQSWWQQRPLAV